MFKFKNKNRGRKNRAGGQTRSPVFSYYTSQNSFSNSNQPPNLRSSKPKLARLKLSGNRRQHLRNLPTYLAISLIVMSILYATTLDSQPKILIGKVSPGNSLVRSQSTYQQAVQDLLSRSLLNRSKLTINTNAVARSIQGEFPEIESATVTLPLLGRRPVVGLDPSEPRLILTSQTNAFIVGQDGRALVSTKDLAKDNQLSLPIVEDKSGLAIEQGKAVLPKDTVAFITTIVNQLKVKHLTVESMILPIVANEVHVKIIGKSYYVKFNLQGDARLQTGTLLAVINKLNAGGFTPSEYIDVRLEERAYYK